MMSKLYMSEIYCGIGKTPKGYKIGAAEECIRKGQIRRYGLTKIEKKLIEDIINNKKTTPTKTKILKNIAALKGKIRTLKLIIDNDKNSNKVKKAIEDLKKYKKETNDLIKKLDDYK